MAVYRKKCEICGGDFISKTPNGKYCSECRVTGQKSMKEYWNHQRKLRREEKNRRQANVSIAEILQRAKENGWSYGRQVAYGRMRCENE